MSSSVGVRFHEAVHGVYFDDLDAFQILHNARYLLLFERTIGSFWSRLGWGSTLDMQKNPDQFHLVRANHIEYHRAVVGDRQRPFRCAGDMAGFGSSSGEVAFRVAEYRHSTTGGRSILQHRGQTQGRRICEHVILDEVAAVEPEPCEREAGQAGVRDDQHFRARW